MYSLNFVIFAGQPVVMRMVKKEKRTPEGDNFTQAYARKFAIV